MLQALQNLSAAKTADYILSRVSIAHFIPGRIRVVCEELKSSDKLKQEIEKRLAASAAVTHFKINPITGSVLVEYDFDKARQDPLIAQLLIKTAEKLEAQKRVQA